MKSLRWWVWGALFVVSQAGLPMVHAQSPSVIYTWDHSFGIGLGNNVETWAKNFGDNAIALDNSTDGILTVTESGVDAAAGTYWAINEGFNSVKESFNGADYGGLDLTGLDALELDIAHDGPNPISGELFGFLTPTSAFTSLGTFTVDPGGLQTKSISLAALSPLQISTIRSLGVHIFGHESDGNRVWQISEIRSAGTPNIERLIADHDDGSTDFDGVLTNFDDSAISGHTAGKNRTGLTINTTDGALQWQESAGGPGAALEWGGGDNLLDAEDFAGRPFDLTNYRVAEVRVRIQSTVPNESVYVQFYMQNEGFMYYAASPDQVIPADGQYHVLRYPLGGIPNRDQVNAHGIEFGPHEGIAQFRVDYFKYTVPEPAAALLWLIGGIAGIGGLRRRS